MLGGGSRERVESGGARPTMISRDPGRRRLLRHARRARSCAAAASTPRRCSGRAAVAVLTESSARQLAPDRDPIGLRLRLARRGEVVVIGVCRDPIDSGALTGIDGMGQEMYVPYEPSPMSRDAVVLARMAGDAHAALAAIAAAAQTPAGSPPARPVVVSDDFREHTGTCRRDGGDEDPRGAGPPCLPHCVKSMMGPGLGTWAWMGARRFTGQARWH